MQPINQDHIFPIFDQSQSDLDSSILRVGLKLSHLRLLVAIEDLGKVSLAAEALNMTQPSASRMLSELEAIMKCPLCRRASRGVLLTPFGEALARRGRKIILELREASREINQLKLGNGGSIHLGAVTAPAMSIVVPAVTKAMESFPGIEINVEIETSNVLIRDLMSATYDFIIGRIPDDVSPALFHVRQIGIERACFVVRSGHPLLENNNIKISDMQNFGWVFQPPGTLLRRAVEDIFLQHQVSLPRNTINTPSIILGMALLSQSNAIMPISSAMADFVTSQSSEMGNAVILPINFDLSVRPYSLITMRDRVLTPSAQLLYDLVLAECQKEMASSAQP
jgi:DNA-binding transcriptional LysR family regulator